MIAARQVSIRFDSCCPSTKNDARKRRATPQRSPTRRKSISRRIFFLQHVHRPPPRRLRTTELRRGAGAAVRRLPAGCLQIESSTAAPTARSCTGTPTVRPAARRPACHGAVPFSRPLFIWQGRCAERCSCRGFVRQGCSTGAYARKV